MQKTHLYDHYSTGETMHSPAEIGDRYMQFAADNAAHIRQLKDREALVIPVSFNDFDNAPYGAPGLDHYQAFLRIPKANFEEFLRGNPLQDGKQTDHLLYHGRDDPQTKFTRAQIEIVYGEMIGQEEHDMGEELPVIREVARIGFSPYPNERTMFTDDTSAAWGSATEEGIADGLEFGDAQENNYNLQSYSLTEAAHFIDAMKPARVEPKEFYPYDPNAAVTRTFTVA
jgi:hypothetical protein